MPGIRLFGRRCSLATDDFLFIGIRDCIFFLPWLGWIPVIYTNYLKLRNTCDGLCAHLLDISLPGLCLLFLFNWLLGGFFIIFSLKGTISNPEPRRHVIKLVYLKLALSVIELGWTILGVIIMHWECYCGIYGVPITIKVVTICQLLLTISRLIRIAIVCDCLWVSKKKSENVVQKDHIANTVTRDVVQRWNLRFQAFCLWCTTASDARKEAIKTSSEIMAILSSDLDMVPTDVVAGILLYRRECLKKWKVEKEALDATPAILLEDGNATDHFPPEHLPSWMNLQFAHRYFDLSLGVFGWAWFVYRHLACGCCLLFKRLTCCFSFRKRGKIVFGDNCCGCNLAGLESTTGLPYNDLVHVSFVDRVFEIPFYVTFDHETSTVLVTLRGTMSMDDVLTDISADFAPLEDAGCPSGSLCHSGMLKAAREIKRKLEDNHLLEIAFKEKPDYNLVITGHSLGASVSSVLTLLLRSSFPNVRCFAFAPAPTLSLNALPETFKCVFTLVYGNDSVVYLGYNNIHGFIREISRCLQKCDMPKYKVFINSKDNQDTSDSTFRSTGDIEKAANGDHIQKIEEDNTPAVDSSNGYQNASENLYVPGTILHIRPADNGYRLRLSLAEDYKPLLFRPNMIFHHFPQNIQACLKKLGQDTTLQATAAYNEQ